MEKHETMYHSKAQESANSTRSADLNELVAQVQNEKTRHYIACRLMTQMEWYSRKSRECKKQFYRWTTVTILIGALIPIVSVFADGSIEMKVLLASLGSVVTACNAYMALHNFKDLWLTYRNLREKLLRILYFYFNHAGVFSQNITQDAMDALLVNICEEEMSGENRDWVSLMQK